MELPSSLIISIMVPTVVEPFLDGPHSISRLFGWAGISKMLISSDTHCGVEPATRRVAGERATHSATHANQEERPGCGYEGGLRGERGGRWPRGDFLELSNWKLEMEGFAALYNKILTHNHIFLSTPQTSISLHLVLYTLSCTFLRNLHAYIGL